MNILGVESLDSFKDLLTLKFKNSACGGGGLVLIQLNSWPKPFLWWGLNYQLNSWP